MTKGLETKVAEFLRKEASSPLEVCAKGSLAPFSYCYRQIVQIRNKLYDKKWLMSHSPPVPVVSVGNVTAGGTGKTPLTLLLAQRLQRDFQVAILTRGYRSPLEKGEHPFILSAGAGPCVGADRCGDEAFLLASRLPQAIVIVGKDRVRSAERAHARGAQIILMDDGMQYRRLERAFEIVMLSSEVSLRTNSFLPRGLLRDDPQRLRHADLIVINGEGELPFQLDVPVVHMRLKVEGVHTHRGPLAEGLQGKKVGLFCAIAHPTRFEKTLKSLGAEVVSTLMIADHRSFSLERLSLFAKEAKKKGAEFLVCTEKDYVKLPSQQDMESQVGLLLAWVACAAEIYKNEGAWENLIQRIQQRVIR